MLMMPSYLFIAFNHPSEKKNLFGPSLRNLGFCYHQISLKSIAGLDNYGLRDYYYDYYFYNLAKI